ncbi:MAG TPA: ATP-binding protein, partial [Verrucomicrobiales bacterium]|nr:ATP-binding protein [Verrucomicrobiales bacterium]
NTEWQRDLSISFNKLGDVARAQGDLAAAAGHYRSGLEIRQKLAAADPGNTGWQRDLSLSLYKLGQVVEKQERWAEALAWMEKSLAVDERLAAKDASNVMWQDDVVKTRAAVERLRQRAAGR